jgi:transcription initiation factor TFIIH subunit 2
MSDSDPEYIGSDDDDTRTNGRRSARTSKAKKADKDAKQGADSGYAWEGEFERTWDLVQEDEEGSLTGVVAGLVQSGKRKRYLLPCWRGKVDIGGDC